MQHSQCCNWWGMSEQVLKLKEQENMALPSMIASSRSQLRSGCLKTSMYLVLTTPLILGTTLFRFQYRSLNGFLQVLSILTKSMKVPLRSNTRSELNSFQHLLNSGLVLSKRFRCLGENKIYSYIDRWQQLSSTVLRAKQKVRLVDFFRPQSATQKYCLKRASTSLEKL